MYPSYYYNTQATILLRWKSKFLEPRSYVYRIWSLHLVAGDAVYNDVHLYLAESNAKSRQEWIAALDKIESLHPRAVIASHKRPGNDDNPGIIEETRQYIRDFDRLAEMATTAQELYDKMH